MPGSSVRRALERGMVIPIVDGLVDQCFGFRLVLRGIELLEPLVGVPDGPVDSFNSFVRAPISRRDSIAVAMS